MLVITRGYLDPKRLPEFRPAASWSRCQGTELHIAALNGDQNRLEELLDKGAEGGRISTAGGWVKYSPEI